MTVLTKVTYYTNFEISNLKKMVEIYRSGQWENERLQIISGLLIV